MRDGFHTITPYLKFDDARKAFEFYKSVLDAVEISSQFDEQGILRHGELRIGNSAIMMSNVMPQFPDLKSAITYGGSPMSLFVYTEDAKAMFDKAIAGGCKVTMPLEEQPYGLSGGLVDPFGYTWWITTHKE